MTAGARIAVSGRLITISAVAWPISRTGTGLHLSRTRLLCWPPVGIKESLQFSAFDWLDLPNQSGTDPSVREEVPENDERHSRRNGAEFARCHEVGQDQRAEEAQDATAEPAEDIDRGASDRALPDLFGAETLLRDGCWLRRRKLLRPLFQ
jgi:hypothetical protein